jgi:RNA polymerase sigma factor (sigma-70 family)
MSPRLSELFLRSQPDEELVRLAQAGNERAFAAIVERYGQELHARACSMRMNGRAEDVVQQTFMSAFTALRSGTEVEHLRGWLHRILRNAAIRSSDRRVVEVQLDPAAVMSEPLEEGAQRRMLAFDTLSSIAALPARQRDALVATALGGESRAAVAASMGVSEGAVRQLMHRARASLRTAATAILPGPLVRWLQVIRNGVRTDQAEIAFGAGTASAGGVAVKVGAILASGVVATGIVGAQLTHRRVVHHSGAAPAHAAVAPTTRGVLNAVTARVRSSGSAGARGRGESSARASNAALRGHAAGAGEREHVVSAPGAPHGAGAGSHGGPRSGTDAARKPAPESGSGAPKGDGSSGGGFEPSGGSGRNGGSTGSDGGSTTGGDGSSNTGAVGSRDGDRGGSTPTSTLGSSDGGSTSGGGSSDGGSSTTSGSSDGGSSSTGSSDGGSSSSGSSGDGGSGSTGSSDSGSSSDG